MGGAIAFRRTVLIAWDSCGIGFLEMFLSEVDRPNRIHLPP